MVERRRITLSSEFIPAIFIKSNHISGRIDRLTDHFFLSANVLWRSQDANCMGKSMHIVFDDFRIIVRRFVGSDYDQ